MNQKDLKLQVFHAQIEIIGINPYVYVPEDILKKIFLDAQKNKGYIPVSGTINGLAYQQTLVKYSGYWRLYMNMKMLPNSPKRIGEWIEITIHFDPEDRTIPIHPKLLEALQTDPIANQVFESLTPSLRKEIGRYISYLKTEQSIDKNVQLAIGFLKGDNGFIGRKPLDIFKYVK